MIKTLTTIGNSLGIIIDKPILEILGIDKDTKLEVKTDGTGLIIRPIPEGGIDALAAPPPPAAEPPPAPSADEDGPSGLPDPPATEAEPPPSRTPPSSRATPASRAPSAPQEPVAEELAETDAGEGADAPNALGSLSGAPEVVVELNGDVIARVPLDTVEKIIGRDAATDIHLDDRALSRKHAKIEKRGAAIWVSDLGSANGTYINGEKVETPRRLHQGDVIGLGHYKIHVAGTAAADAKMPVLTLSGPEGTHRFAMVGEQIVIGRSQSCDISIGHKSISRRHVRIGIQGDSFVVEDLGSQNGAKLNGRTMQGVEPFAPGDRIDVCDFSIELGYLEDEADGGDKKNPNRPSTMLIDKSAMAQAAYVDGDFENVRSRLLEKGTGNRAKVDTGEYDVKTSQPKAVKKKKKKRKRAAP